jgi:hypothetical protein
VIVNFLRAAFADLQTYVADGDLCASACSNLFLSGAHTFEGESYETIAMRAIAPTARLGVHAPRIVLPDDGETYDAEEVAAVFTRRSGIRLCCLNLHKWLMTKAHRT